MKKILGLGLFLLLVSFLFIYDSFRGQERIASMLDIKMSPASLRVVDCESPFATDVLVTCAIEVDSVDFTMLLEGYSYKKRAISASSYSVVGPNIGKEFEVTEEFSVEPDNRKFKNGGRVQIFTDKQKKRAIIDYYIE
ncbi:hypothetical protein [Fodinibius salsisoli]|uniref:Uncharacterized protein n=1 Tax=Fodinibius salsisoli TaxID=2820877 RepID=A0ABT3PM02_9BACT|nr:hypothetical protein [Fodinibius salsisoli]MCW9706980.1 hypothetical protein [Fodinibius salsisoli]